MTFLGTVEWARARSASAAGLWSLGSPVRPTLHDGASEPAIRLSAGREDSTEPAILFTVVDWFLRGVHAKSLSVEPRLWNAKMYGECLGLLFEFHAPAMRLCYLIDDGKT
jgi:hypothetical protein